MANTPKFTPVPEKLAKARAEAGERVDMVHVKLRKAQPGLREGEVLFVDVSSAGHLVGRGDAEYHDPSKTDEEVAPAFPVARGRANVQTMVVKGSDLPSPPAVAGESPTLTGELVETGTGAGSPAEADKPAKRS